MFLLLKKKENNVFDCNPFCLKQGILFNSGLNGEQTELEEKKLFFFY